MAAITFDGPARVVTLGFDGPVTQISAIDIYSAWKLWVAAGNAQYLPAFADSVGGNALGGGASLSGYFFLRNDLGWRFQPEAEDYEIQVSGDLYPASTDTVTFPWVLAASGAHSALLTFQRSAASYVVAAGGGGGSSPAEVADAVWNRASSAHTSLTSMGGVLRMLGILGRNKTVTDPVAGTMTVYADNGVDVQFTAPLWEDVDGAQAYRGQGADRRDRLV